MQIFLYFYIKYNLYKNKEPRGRILGGSESGGYLLSHNAVQYHRRCCLSALAPLRSAALRSLPRPRPSAPPPPHGFEMAPIQALRLYLGSEQCFSAH